MTPTTERAGESAQRTYFVRVNELHSVVYAIEAESEFDAIERYGEGSSEFVACLDSTVTHVGTDRIGTPLSPAPSHAAKEQV